MAQEHGTTNAAPAASKPDPVDYTTRPATAAPGATGNDGSGLGMSALLDQFSAMSALPEAAKTYLDKVTADLKVRLPHLRVEHLQQPNGTYVFILENRAIILLFSECLQTPLNPPHAPKSRNIDLARMEMSRKLGSDITPLNAVLVSPNDYGKASAMIKYIGDHLMITTSKNLPFNITNLTKNSQYSVDCNVDMAKQLISQYSPHGTLPRTDIGLVVYFRQPDSNSRIFAREGLAEPDLPILAIGGYTEFIEQVDQTTGTMKYLPLVRITSITPLIPVPALALIGIYLAAEQFCTQRRWQDPFYTLNKRGPNIGNLVNDPAADGKPFVCTTREQVAMIISTHCYPAMLAIDVCEGQARIPAISAFQDTAGGAAQIHSYISQFFTPGQTLNMGTAITAYSKMEFVGYYGDNDSKDTRDTTYLNALASGAVPQEVKPLMHWPTNPEQPAALVNHLTGGMHSMYLATTAVIDPQFLASFGQVLAQCGISITTTMTAANTASMGNLMDQAARMMNLQTVTGNQFANPGYNSRTPHWASGF